MQDPARFGATSRLLTNSTKSEAHMQLEHAADDLVDVLFPVARIAALDEVVADAREAAHRAVHLEGPQELGALLRVGRVVRDRVGRATCCSA